jgi:hypothetical protein
MEFLRREEILAARRPYHRARQFIYFLIRDEEIIYVGQSEAPLGRIAQHVGYPGRDFDSYHIIELPEGSDVDEVERQYIFDLKPESNYVRQFPKSFEAIGETPEARIRYRIEAGQSASAAARAEGINVQSFYKMPLYRELTGRSPRRRTEKIA